MRISLLVCSRISGNKNWSLFSLLESLKKMSANYGNFEVLIKFDSDDKRVGRVLPKLDTYPFKIKYIIECRGRGYVDVHVFYNRLFSQVDERSVVIGAMADDFEIIQEDWDEIILSKINVFQDQIFIMRGRPHPPNSRKNYREQKFYLDFDINSLEDSENVEIFPLLSRKLLDICGGFGYVSFTDAWTLMLEYFLFHRCGVSRTIFLEQPIIHRGPRDVDGPSALRWWTERANNFAFMRSGFYKTLVEQQALNIYSYIKMSELSALPLPLVQKKSDFNPIISAQDNLWRLRRLMSYLKLERAIYRFVVSRPRLYRFVVSRPRLKSFVRRVLGVIRIFLEVKLMSDDK